MTPQFGTNGDYSPTRENFEIAIRRDLKCFNIIMLRAAFNTDQSLIVRHLTWWDDGHILSHCPNHPACLSPHLSDFPFRV